MNFNYYHKNDYSCWPSNEFIDLCTRYTNDEMGYSYLFADFYFYKYRYVVDDGCWYYYWQGCWKKDHRNIMVEEGAMLLVERMRLFPELNKYTKQLVGLSKRKKMIEGARCIYPLYKKNFDTNAYLLNLLNCVIDLRNINKPLDHEAEYFFTKQFNAHYEDLAVSKPWEKFIMEIMCNDPDLVRYLQKLLGYMLVGHSNEEFFVVLYGKSTRNGKGTLMNTIRRIFNTYGATMQPASIANRVGDGKSPLPDIARLAGIRLVTISELRKNFRLNDELMKQLSGNDPVAIRNLFKDIFELSPQFTICMSTNYEFLLDPTFIKSRRIRLVPFDRHFTEDEQDNTLKDTFAEPEHMTGIFNWLLKGYALYVEEGLKNVPKRAETSLHEFSKQADTVKLFIDDRMVECNFRRIQTKDVHKEYLLWCEEMDFDALTLRKFVAYLREKDILGHDRSLGHYIKGYDFEKQGNMHLVLASFDKQNDEGWVIE